MENKHKNTIKKTSKRPTKNADPEDNLLVPPNANKEKSKSSKIYGSIFLSTRKECKQMRHDGAWRQMPGDYDQQNTLSEPIRDH